MSSRELPTGIVTFLFSDIEGSTRLLQHLGRAAYLEAFERHNEIFRSVAGDAVVSTEGDSFFCVFPDVGEAVLAALEVQWQLATEEWPAGAEIRVRMGLHTGEGLPGGDDYVGIDVHRAARIAAAAHGGQIIASAATVERIGPGDARIVVEQLGEHRLKDLAHPVWLYQLSRPGAEQSFPPLVTLGTRTVRLPDYVSAFIGREDEVGAVRAALREARLVTLVGPGGSGKTRLSVAVAHELQDGFPGGVFFVSAADLDEGALIAAHTASTLGLRDQVGTSHHTAIVDELEGRTALIVLDNCEHVLVEAASFVDALLDALPHLRMIVTSREALTVTRERRIEVGPLPWESAPDEIPAALALFAACAGEVAPGFDLDRWRDECVEICRRLDGIPLAIELAAARSDVLTPDQISSLLDDRFGLLKRRRSGGEARHETLEAAIDWSYSLLDERAAGLLRAVSVCRGGFDLAAANALTGGSDPPDLDVVDALSELRAQSLVTQEIGVVATRFRLMETIRAFAADRAAQEGELNALLQRHRDHFTAMASVQSRRLGTGDQLAALEELEADHDNMRAIMRRAMEAGDFEAAAAVAGRLAWFWYLHAHFTEGERWAGSILAELPPNPRRVWLWLLLGAAQFDERIGKYERAGDRLDAALRIAGEQGERRVEMWTYAYLATNDYYRGEMEDAARRGAVAIDIAGELGDPLGLGYSTFMAIGVDAWLAQARGALDAASADELAVRLAPMLAWATESGDRNMIGHLSQAAAVLADRGGHRKLAAETFSTGIAALTELGTVGCACHLMEASAAFLAEQGSGDDALVLIGATARLRADVGIAVAQPERYFVDRARSLASDGMSDDEVRGLLEAGTALGLAESAEVAQAALGRLAAAPPGTYLPPAGVELDDPHEAGAEGR